MPWEQGPTTQLRNDSQLSKLSAEGSAEGALSRVIPYTGCTVLNSAFFGLARLLQQLPTCARLWGDAIYPSTPVHKAPD